MKLVFQRKGKNMAKYHGSLQYHEDNIDKHKITVDEIEFLKQLQKEMNTQDHICQADPRFWVIKGTERLYHVEEPDGYELYDKYGCDTVAEDMKEIVEYIVENLLDDINKKQGTKYNIELNVGIFSDSILVNWTDDDGEEESEELENLQDIQNWLEGFGYDEYVIISYKYVPKIYENTMFLTQKDAEDHLRSNDYHYSSDAHTYAMTAWRSPAVEKLVNILQTVDWAN